MTYVVKKTMRDIGSAQYPMLMHTNYAEWSVMMKVMLQARGLWAAVTTSAADEQEGRMAMEGILKAVPPEFITTLGEKDTAKEAWESLKTMRQSGDRVLQAKAQQLRREYEAVAFRDGEAIEDFALRLTTMVSQLGKLGDTISKEEAVAKFPHVAPPRFAQLALSIVTLLDLSTLSIEDVTGHLKVVEDRAEAPAQTTVSGKLLLTEEWKARVRQHKQGEGSSAPRGGGGGGARGKHRGKLRRKVDGGGQNGGGRAADKDRCLNCGKTGH
jgi:hypothetical protein